MTTNMQGKTGRAVANQFVINENGKLIFKSYTTNIAIIKNGVCFTAEGLYNYSRTTAKYFRKFADGLKVQIIPENEFKEMIKN